MMVPAAGSAMQNWYVAQTRHLSEARAAHELEAQGMTVFLPRYLKRHSHARKVTWKPAPLFPGYLFVSFDPAIQRWRSINGTLGVARLGASNDGPAALAPGIVEKLMARRNSAGYIALPQRPVFHPGEPVRITHGSFENSLGLFEDFTDQDRVAVLLELLGRKVRVVLEEDMIEKAA
jgi:transcriptional antiterminator RfaH